MQPFQGVNAGVLQAIPDAGGGAEIGWRFSWPVNWHPSAYASQAAAKLE